MGQREGAVCYLCGEVITKQWEIDHVIPKCNDDCSRPLELAWTHRRCNRLKHDMTIEELKALATKILRHLS